MNPQELAQFTLNSLTKAGADKAQVRVSLSQKTELNIEAGEIFLMRTNFDNAIHLKALKGKRQGSLSLNQVDEESILKAAEELMSLVEASPEDDAYDIAPQQELKKFEYGSFEPDTDAMYARLEEYRGSVQRDFPELILDGCHLEHNALNECFLNSNGLNFASKTGSYNFMSMFAAKRGSKVSSFNYIQTSLKDMSEKLEDKCGLLQTQKESVAQIDKIKFEGHFAGDVVIHPNCVMSLLGGVLTMLADQSLISGNSLFKDKMGHRVLSDKLTLRSQPRDPSMARMAFYDGDGVEEHNTTLFEKGVLKSFLLSLYGSRKLGLPKSQSSGTHLVLDPGAQAFEKMIGNVKKGILLNRFSGGRPGENGDFSGVAKNSFLIENGKIKEPLAEVMVSGNLIEMLNNVAGISKDVIDTGTSRLPWIHAQGLKISGK
jgi:PmbA protein